MSACSSASSPSRRSPSRCRSRSCWSRAASSRRSRSTAAAPHRSGWNTRAEEVATSEALQALYAGEVEKARDLLPPDDDVSVFEAAAFGRVERLKAILAADPSQATGFADDGFTALHLAVFAGQEETARILIDGGADVNVRSTGSIAEVPPLGTAAFARSVPLARLLLDRGADVNGQGAGGFTALHTAAQNGDEELVGLLLARGAEPELANSAGKRPVDIAADDRVRSLLAR